MTSSKVRPPPLSFHVLGAHGKSVTRQAGNTVGTSTRYREGTSDASAFPDFPLWAWSPPQRHGWALILLRRHLRQLHAVPRGGAS